MVRCWDMATGEAIGKPLTGQMAMAIGAINTHLVGITASRGDYMLSYWNLATGRRIFSVDLGGVEVHALLIYGESYVAVGTKTGLLVLQLRPERIAPLLDG